MGTDRCVVLVPDITHLDPRCDDALRGLEKLDYVIRRGCGRSVTGLVRDQMVADALADGFDEIFWVNANIVFEPEDVQSLRSCNMPFACGIYPEIEQRRFACEFFPDTPAITFGNAGGLIRVLYSGFGFVYTHRKVYDAVRVRHQLPTLNRGLGNPLVPYFSPFWMGGQDGGRYLAEDYAFCERARLAGFELIADTRLRLWHVGVCSYGWEDAGSDKPRFGTYTFTLAAPSGPVSAPPPVVPELASTAVAALPDPGALREHAVRASFEFPRIRLYVVTYSANADSLALTLESIRASDWGEEPVVLVQPDDWPRGKESASRNYKRALEHAADDGCDFAVILEDDVRVGRHFRSNLLSNPLIIRDVCDYMSLFMPDLIASPWERSEAQLGYRLAKPLYSGPNLLWEKYRIWGSQGYALSQRFVRASLERWDRLKEGQDSRVISVCSELRLPLWYTAPCLVEHAPLRSAFGTPSVRAVDFDHELKLAIGDGFQPPDGVPGWLSEAEGRELWRIAAGRSVLELGTSCGRATVCLAQSARRVITVDRQDQGVAAEWVRRFGCADRVEFRRWRFGSVVDELRSERFGLVFVDMDHDAVSVRRDLEVVVQVLDSNGLIAVHDYPDPGWPDVRCVVDEFAARFGWVRVAQTDYLGVFRALGG